MTHTRASTPPACRMMSATSDMLHPRGTAFQMTTRASSPWMAKSKVTLFVPPSPSARYALPGVRLSMLVLACVGALWIVGAV